MPTHPLWLIVPAKEMTLPNFLTFFKPKKEPQYPYEQYLFDFEILGDRPSPAKVKREYPEGDLRLKAFEWLCQTYPNDVRYVQQCLESRVNHAIYGQDFQPCFSLIERGLTLEDCDSAHERLRQIRDRLHQERDELIEEMGLDAINQPEPDELYHLLRSGRHDELLLIFESVRHSHKPQGILGGNEDQRFWMLYAMAIEVYFHRRDYRQALSLVSEYEQKRISVRLTPIPPLGVQEMVIGCLAQMSLQDAVEKIRFWLANSRMPIIVDVIKHHRSFRHLFG